MVNSDNIAPPYTGEAFQSTADDGHYARLATGLFDEVNNPKPITKLHDPRIRHFLESAGMPTEKVERYRELAFLRLGFTPDHVIPNYTGEAGGFGGEILKVAQLADKLGPETVHTVAQKYDIANMWLYGSSELETLAKLSAGDQATVEHFQAGDTTVVFRDVRADTVGAIVNADAQSLFAKPSGRTLSFEFNEAQTIYRRFVELRRLGIEPSQVVYEFHGDTSSADLCNSLARVALTTKPFESTQYGRGVTFPRINMNDLALRRLSREFMQPNRGIDAPDHLTGYKVVVLAACYTAKRTWADRLDGALSLAETYARNTDDNVVVYGSRHAVEVRAGDGGISFYAGITGRRRVPVVGHRTHRLTPNDTVVTTTKEPILRLNRTP